MKLRLCSDLHIEFYNANKINRQLGLYLPKMKDDKDIVLCIAGDVGMLHKPHTMVKPLQYLSKRFKAVVLVNGNHSFYHNDYVDRFDQWLSENDLPINVYFLNDGWLEIDDTMFLGSVLWTDFDKANPIYMRIAEGRMNDYQLIRKSKPKNEITSMYSSPYSKVGSVLSATDTVECFNKSKEFIFRKVKDHKKCVVITHHLPSYAGIDNNYRGSELNPAYASELSEEIMNNPSIKIWLHGHVHTSHCIDIGDTKLVCNALGYHGYDINKLYNKTLTMEI